MALIRGCDDAVVADVETAGHRLGAARIADARSRCIMFGARFVPNFTKVATQFHAW